MSKFICEFCGYAAKSGPGLKTHRTRLHKGEVLPAEPVVEEVVEKVSDPVVEKVDGPAVEAPLEPVIKETVLESVVDEPKPVPVLEAPPFVEESVVEDSLFREPSEEGSPLAEEPTPAPQDVGIKEIPVGARVLLNGTFWNKNSEGAYLDQSVSNLECRVNDKLEQGGFMYLQLIGSDKSDWCCTETAVLDGTVKLLSLKDPTTTPFAPPEAPVPISEDDSKAQLAYFEACKRYAEARDAKSVAEKEYKAVDEVTRPEILTYVDAHGRESIKGKRDNVLKAGGFEVHHTFSEGKVSIKRETQKIIEWCIANGHPYAIKPALDEEVWDSIVERGNVPAEFLTQVHKPVKAKNARKLLIKEIAPDSE